MALNDSLREQIFELLEELKDSGSINMLGSGEYIAGAFSLTEKEGKEWLAEWIKSKTVSVKVSGVTTET
jgi:hypothetical protein|tara:strand:+ start:571 stop:777 length:207 start_codon:yes stop_codon:yes gene_type:complete